MFSLISICDLSFWQIFIAWLLPFLLGLLLGWFLWGFYKRRYHEVANDRDDLEDELDNLEVSLQECLNEKKEALSNLKKNAPAQESGAPGEEVQYAFGIATSKFTALDHDNLQVFEGIGPKMSEYLHSQGINSWETLANYDEHYLKDLLAKEGNKYRIIDPTSWPAQANLAVKGEWEKLITLQKSLLGGKKGKGDASDSKIEKILVRLGILKKWKQDDLKAIEGIGPKIEELLKSDGINTWQILADTEVVRLSDLLEKAGKRYRLADPGTWPKQAKLAAEGKWSELDLLQDQLKGGKEK